MWTTENSEFTQAELDIINPVLERIWADAGDEIDLIDLNNALGNEWEDGITEAELEAAIRRRLGI